MDLHGKSASLGLPFAFSRSLFAKLSKVLAADGIGKHNFFHGAAEAAIADGQLNAHLGLAAQSRDTFTKSAPVRSNRLTDSIFGIEDCSKTKWQHGRGAETLANHPSMFQD